MRGNPLLHLMGVFLGKSDSPEWRGTLCVCVLWRMAGIATVSWGVCLMETWNWRKYLDGIQTSRNPFTQHGKMSHKCTCTPYSQTNPERANHMHGFLTDIDVLWYALRNGDRSQYKEWHIAFNFPLSLSMSVSHFLTFCLVVTLFLSLCPFYFRYPSLAPGGPLSCC